MDMKIEAKENLKMLTAFFREAAEVYSRASRCQSLCLLIQVLSTLTLVTIVLMIVIMITLLFTMKILEGTMTTPAS